MWRIEFKPQKPKCQYSAPYTEGEMTVRLHRMGCPCNFSLDAEVSEASIWLLDQYYVCFGPPSEGYLFPMGQSQYAAGALIGHNLRIGYSERARNSWGRVLPPGDFFAALSTGSLEFDKE